MKLINSALDACRSVTRTGMAVVARSINEISGGRITANMVTVTSTLMHVVIALLIAFDSHTLAAVTLIVFGLFDTLDGELARLQKKASPAGMVLDATTDRLKEVLLYTGASFYLASQINPTTSAVAVLALGSSILVSYAKAKAETAIATSKKMSSSEANRFFSSGVMRFEVRMTVLVVALLLSQLFWGVLLIALFASITALNKLLLITRVLHGKN